MKITYKPSAPREIVRLFCPECGERVRNVGLFADSCNINGLSVRCKRCRKYTEVSAQSEKTK